jgi:predicted phage gp36 major capsid-like protein
MAPAITTTTTKIAILGDWSGFTIVDRLGSTVELIPNLFGRRSGRPANAVLSIGGVPARV